MRVVLDTNVLLSGLFTRGICEAVLDACAAPPFTIVLSEHILAEFTHHARVKFHAPRADVDLAVAMLRSRSDLVVPGAMPKDACEDPDDLPVLGTAIAGAADVLVTGDSALVRLRAINTIPIVTPRAFYDGLR